MSGSYVTWILIAAAIAALVIAARRRSPGGDSNDPRLAADARRFARLLVSEIKLDHPAQVQEGMLNRDLYARLRSEIDLARERYAERVAPTIQAENDYFADALVDILADGDAGALAGYGDERGDSTLVH